jgi:outer membrane protein assembly factor BamE (lipoprotein component of BamABCDE complex)
MLPMRRITLRVLAAIVGVSVLCCVFVLGGASTIEAYNVLAPYADTEFAPEYTPEKFDKVKAGMRVAEVEALIGKPLYQHVLTYDYTNDGYLRKRTDGKYQPGDLAWYKSVVYFDTHWVVVGVEKGWIED